VTAQHAPTVLAAADGVLPAELLAAAGTVADGFRAVADANGVDEQQVVAVFGDLDVRAVQLVAVSWRRRGKLALDTTVPRPVGVIRSEQLAAATVDQHGRVSPGNAGILAGLVRRLHPDVQAVCGVVTWSVRTPDGHAFREVLVPGDWVVECGDGTCRVVPDPEAG
jgi:hypothetical protein